VDLCRIIPEKRKEKTEGFKLIVDELMKLYTMFAPHIKLQSNWIEFLPQQYTISRLY
jgi:hypothetical protein